VAGVSAPSCQAVCECPLRQDAVQSAKFRSSAAVLQSLRFDALLLCRPQMGIFRVRLAKRASTRGRWDKCSCCTTSDECACTSTRYDSPGAADTRPLPAPVAWERTDGLCHF
jgi:hypothetical protein